MDWLADTFGMPLFPHIYAIPMSIVLGMAIGYFMRGKLDETPEKLPQKPKV